MKNKEKRIQYFHIAIIILGIIFISIPIFHNNLWFDESYSVGMANKSFIDIWKIGSNDVHPVLYYWILHLAYLIFGANIYAYRIMSMIPIAILGILGYTHIRKDFGEKVGLLFSFLILFLPVVGQYAGEIRMYTLGMLLGTIMAIYAYRILKKEGKYISYILFGLSSLLVAYTHYYGLMLAGIINLLLFIYLCKNRKERKKDLIIFIVIAALQVLLYAPWLLAFLKQIQNVSDGFWITLTFPETVYDILTMQYKGHLSVSPVILSTAFYAYIIYMIFNTKKEERKPAIWCIGIYISIILIAWIISLCMPHAILLDRYLLLITGLLVFSIAFFMAKDNKRWRIITVCTLIVMMSGISNIIAIKENYNEHNRDCIKYIQSNIKEDDILIYSDAINGAVITTEIKGNNKSYFYDKDNWNVDEEYKAFGTNLVIKDTLKEILDGYKGRVWVIESLGVDDLYKEINSKYKVNKIENKEFKVKYKDYSYNITLLEK